MNKKLMAIGAVVLSCSLLFACGKADDKQKKSESTSAAETQKSGDESKGDTKTSSFNPGGGKKSGSSETEKPGQDSAAANGNTSQNGAAGGSSKSKLPTSAVQAELDDAASFAASGMLDDAREMIGYIDRESLSDEQKAQYDRIVSLLDSNGAEKQGSFTPQDALDIIEKVYGVSFEGDTSGIQSQTDGSGREYYRLQIEIPSENVRKTVDVYSNGDITEISSEPLAFG